MPFRPAFSPVSPQGAPVSARRYGGAHSPGRKTRWSGRKTRTGSLRAAMLYIWPSWLPLWGLGDLLGGEAGAAALSFAIWGVLMGSAWLTAEGIKAARAFEAQAIAKPPAWPRKLFGAATTALGVGLLAASGDAGLFSTGLWAVLAGGLHLWTFGPDPMRSKGLDGLEGAALDAAVTRIETARRLVGEMLEAAASTEDALIAARTGVVADAAGEIIARLERDPSELPKARRFLAVYLVGARDAAVKYAQSAQGEPSRARFLALLDDLAAQFAQNRVALTESGEQALEIEIDVLRERLRAEGI